MKVPVLFARKFARMISVVFLVLVGSTALVRLAPGYLSDVREMDPRYANAARAELSAEAARSRSLLPTLSSAISGWSRGNAGFSRQYGIPVSELVAPRLPVTGKLLLRSILLGWALGFSGALFASTARKLSVLSQAPATLLLAVPTAALATVCLLADTGGPVLVMGVLLAARDFKFLSRILRKAWLDPYLLQARAQGLRTSRLVLAHMLPALAPQLSALVSLSIVAALSAVVPVEVIFDVPGVGQLAWNAAMNRDLPVLLAVTVIMALAVALSGITPEGTDGSHDWKAA